MYLYQVTCCNVTQVHLLVFFKIDIMYAFPPGVAPLCSEDDLPVPANGNKSCKAIMSHDLKCELTCSANHHFGTSLDISPQYCRNGEWDFQRDGQSVPDCVGEVKYCTCKIYTSILVKQPIALRSGFGL